MMVILIIMHSQIRIMGLALRQPQLAACLPNSTYFLLSVQEITCQRIAEVLVSPQVSDRLQWPLPSLSAGSLCVQC